MAMRFTKRVLANKAAVWMFLVTALALGMLGSARTAAQQPPPPGPEHALFKDWEGAWDATVKSMGSESKGSLTCKVGLGGFWFLEQFEGKFGGAPFEGRGSTTY